MVDDGPRTQGEDRLRFAVAMRGGVSLAVWIGGALHEIRSLATGPSRVLGLTRFRAVDVDVLTGASAGGLNAALAGLESARGGVVDMRTVWLELADIDRLLDQRNPAPLDGRTRRSVLNGDYFLEQLRAQFGSIVPDTAPQAPVEVFLAATVLAGNTVTDPSDRAFSDRRSEAYFHYRHLGAHPAFSDFSTANAPLHLARAARCTASFPVAFEPVEVDLDDVEGTLHLDAPVPTGATSVRLYDGGIVDNIPLGRAIRAVADAPSHQRVGRWMLFLHPSPEVERPAAAPAATPTTVIGVLRDFLGAAGHETLLDDLADLRTNNDEVAARATNLVAVAESALNANQATLTANPMPDVDAYRLYALLDAPGEALCWRPVGAPIPPSPIAALDRDARYRVRRSLSVSLRSASSSVRPFARTVRHAHTTISWIRWRERNGGPVAAADRRLVYDVLTVARIVDAALDLTMLDSPITNLVTDRTTRLAQVETSVSVHRVVTALQQTDGDDPLVERLMSCEPELADVLGRLAGGELPTDTADGSELLSDRLRWLLASVGATLGLDADGRAFAPDAPVSLFTVLRDHLIANPGVASTLDALDRIDLADVGSHRGRAIGMHQSLNYQRISGARWSPLADPGVLPRLDLTFPADSDLVGATVDDRMEPSAKLSGNALANFSAFFSRRFRANDWMWGRLDAASALADLLIRPDLVCEGLTAEQAKQYLLGDVGDGASPSSVDEVMDAAWKLYGDDVAAELAGGSDPQVLRALVTLRWQLEILDAELPNVFASPLDTGGAPAPYPPVEPPSDDARPDASVSAWRERLAAYDRLDRSVTDLWGRSKSVALGVRVVRNATAAVLPGDGIHTVARTGLGALLLVAMSALVNPASFLVGVNVLWLLVVVPRATGVFAWAALGLAAGVSLLYWIALVSRAHRDRRIRIVPFPGSLPLLVVAGGVVVGLYGLTVARLSNGFLRDSCFAAPGWEPTMGTVRCWETPADLVNPLAVAVVVFVAGVVLWSWAKPVWRLVVSLATALLMGVGTFLSDTHADNPRVLVQIGTSLWLFAAVSLVATTLVALLARPEHRPS